MTEREQFEAWAKQPPMEWDCERYTENEAWPDNYRNYPTQCAWEGWQAARAQPAQAVPVLTDDPLFVFAQEVIHGAYKPGELKDAAMRAIRHHSAVQAKMGVAVPMTDPQLQTSEERRATGERIMALATNELSDLVRRARAIVVGHQRGSISLVQRHLRISYNTAAKLLEALEQEGVVSPQRNNGQREVLVLPDISGIVGKEGA